MPKKKDDHAVLAQWLVIIVGSFMLSGFIMFAEPSITGFAIVESSEVELKPNLVGKEEYFANMASGIVIFLVLVVTQVGIYFIVKRFYREE